MVQILTLFARLAAISSSRPQTIALLTVKIHPVRKHALLQHFFLTIRLRARNFCRVIVDEWRSEL